MITYEETSTFSGIENSGSTVYTRSQLADDGFEYDFTHLASSYLKWFSDDRSGDTELHGGPVMSSGTASMIGTEVPYVDDSSSTVTVSSSETQNNTGYTAESLTWSYYDAGGFDSVTVYTTSSSSTKAETSFRMFTSVSTQTTVTRTRSTTATHTTTAHTLTLSAGSTITASMAATLTATTSTTATRTESSATTQSTTAARAASQYVYRVARAASDELLAAGPAVSSANETTVILGSDYISLATSIYSFTPTSAVSHSWSVPTVQPTYSLVTISYGFSSTVDSVTLLTATTTTAAIGNATNRDSSSVSTITRWSTSTYTSSSFRYQTPYTKTSSSLGQSSWLRTATQTVLQATHTIAWGHATDLTPTTYSIHGRLVTSSTYTQTSTAFPYYSSTTATTVFDPIMAILTTFTNHYIEAHADEEELVTEDLGWGMPGVDETFAASFTTVTKPDLAHPYTAGSLFAAEVNIPAYLPGRQPASAYGSTAPRYLNIAASVNSADSLHAASAHPDGISVNYAASLTNLAETVGASQAALLANRRSLCSYRTSYETIYPYSSFQGTIVSTDDFRTAGLGGYGKRSSSFSEMVRLRAGLWSGTTQEGTSTGTSTYASDATFSASDGRQTALEPLGTVALDLYDAEVFGVFNTTHNAS